MLQSRAPLPALGFEAVSKSYLQPSGEPFHALDGVSFGIDPGSTVAIVGRSGSGKSTLLHLAAGIDAPSRGSVRWGGVDIASLSERKRTLARRKSIGLVFQFFHLVPHLNVVENVCLPGWIAGDSYEASRARAMDLLARVGLGDRAEQRAARLSGGEMQRVAICRALLRSPKLLLADEPTGNLDERTGATVMRLLLDLTEEERATLIFVTHSMELASRATRTIRLQNGAVEEDRVCSA